jgi:DNA-binding transcriptional MerR regulator
MKIKMAELVEKTNVPKSTILYYIKEGLLPEPERIKQNVCLYDESCIEHVKFIKFLQTTYGRSIAEIKHSMCSHGYDFSKGSDLLIGFLEKLSGTSANTLKITKEELIAKSGVDEKFVDLMLQKELLIPLSDGFFDEKDMEILGSYKKLIDGGWSIEFFEKYIELSRELATYAMRETVRIKKELRDNGGINNEMQHLMFEIPLSIEPYIINRLGIREYQKIINLERQA